MIDGNIDKNLAINSNSMEAQSKAVNPEQVDIHVNGTKADSINFSKEKITYQSQNVQYLIRLLIQICKTIHCLKKQKWKHNQ